MDLFRIQKELERHLIKHYEEEWGNPEELREQLHSSSHV